MIRREIEAKLQELAKHFEIIAVIGPRQSGKTTLLRSAYPNYKYFNFEQLATRNRAEADLQQFVQDNHSSVIFDEVQNIPEILSYLQVIVDEYRFAGKSLMGKIFISGSQNLLISDKVSQSLAGRAAYLEMFPLTQQEIANDTATIYESIIDGSYPGKIANSIPSSTFYEQYILTYLERDVRALRNIKNISSFCRFISLLAGRVGSIVDYTSLSNDVGVSVNTIKNWVSLLEASYLIFTLPPYYNNFGKRYIKSPKIFFTDTGILCQLLGIQNTEVLKTHPLIGNIFENFCILEVLKTTKNRGMGAKLFYFRNTNGNEVDLLLESNNTLNAIEIKLGSSFTQSYLKGLKYFSNIVGDSTPITEKHIIYTGDSFNLADVNIMNYKLLHTILS